MKNRSFVLFAAFALAANACSSSLTDPGAGHRVQVTIAKTNYYTGDTIHVDVRNLSDLLLTFPGGFCPAVLQESTGGGWSTISAPQGCPLSLEQLGAHGRASFEMPVPNGLQGYYRILLPAPIPPNAAAEAPLTVEFSVNSNAY
jgi:hypothetical protein